MSEPMPNVENVDKFEIEWNGGHVVMKFMDIFKDGVGIGMPLEDAIRFRNSLSAVIRGAIKR